MWLVTSIQNNKLLNMHCVRWSSTLTKRQPFIYPKDLSLTANCPIQVQETSWQCGSHSTDGNFLKKGQAVKLSANTHDKYGVDRCTHQPVEKIWTGHRKHSYKTYSPFIQNVESIHKCVQGWKDSQQCTIHITSVQGHQKIVICLIHQ